MQTLAETIEHIDSSEASIARLFEGDGTRIRGRKRATAADFERVETFIEAVRRGRVSRAVFQETMSTSDFSLLFGDVIDRQLLGSYQATTPEWRQLFRIGTVPDFREVKRFASDGANGQLTLVPELSEYPERAVDESVDTYAVAKYGARIMLSWETMQNDDLGFFSNLPSRLAQGAIRSEEKFATSLLFDSNGPNAALYNSGFGNIIPGNPPLTSTPQGIADLQTAFTMLASMVDSEGEPIVFNTVFLAVPPALEITARNILNATQLWFTNGSGDFANVQTNNWMRNRVQLVVLPYIPHVVTGANGNTSWLLLGSPSEGRPVVEFGFLRGNETPALFRKDSDSTRVGGGPALEDFDNDSIAWKVRHIYGGTALVQTSQGRGTVASNGSGTGS